ncbi:MAG: hypothetical protein ACREU5_01360 [Burkholderiales bacterium]
MDSLYIGSTARIPLTLGAVVLSGCLAGLGALTGWSHLALDDSRPAATAKTADECYYCGVVEQVREIERMVPSYGVSTVAGGRDEMIVMLLSALSGTPVTSGPTKIYEVSVRMDNGSIRAVRGSHVPDWKLGERVKVVKGRVEPLS